MLWFRYPPFPPPRSTRVPFPPGYLARLLSPFFQLPPLRPFLCSRPTTSSSVWSPVVLPSEVFSPPADGQPMSSSGGLSGVCRFAPPPPDLCGWCYLAWVWVEGQRRRHPPAMVWSPSTCWQASPGLACLCRRSISLFDSYGARLSVCPPPPSPFLRTTVRVPILSLLTEEYFRVRSARPCPAGPGRPVERFKHLRSSSVSPPPASLFHGHLFWIM